MTKTKLAAIAAVVTIVGGITAAVTDISNWFKPDKPPADLKLVSTRLVEESTSRGEVVDLQVTNEGGQIAFVTAVEFRISRLGLAALSGGVPSSETYDIQLPVGRPADLEGTTFLAPLSQRVDAGDVDRFTLNIGSAATGGSMMYDYEVTLRLVYNEGKHTEYSGPLRLRIY